MAKKLLSIADKIAAVQEFKKSGDAKATAKKYRVSDKSIYGWSLAYARGTLQKKKLKASKAPAVSPDDDDEFAEPKPRGMPLETRVQKAITLLREAERVIDEMKQAGIIKGPDHAHRTAGMALSILEGNYGR